MRSHDWAVPDLNGAKLAEQARLRRKQLKILFTTWSITAFSIQASI